MAVWWLTRYGVDGASQTQIVSYPLLTSLILYVVIGLIRREDNTDRDALIDSLNTDPGPEGHTKSDEPVPAPVTPN
jgi:hypothetical protein